MDPIILRGRRRNLGPFLQIVLPLFQLLLKLIDLLVKVAPDRILLKIVYYFTNDFYIRIVFLRTVGSSKATGGF